MPKIAEFTETLKEMEKLHIKKNNDYATDTNPFFNFDKVTEMVSLFEQPSDKTFAHFIANKFSRLATLLNSGKSAENESVQDTLIDMANYCILWKCDISRRCFIPFKGDIGNGPS